MTEEAKEGQQVDQEVDYDQIRIPKGAPYVIAVFKGYGSALADVAKGNGVLPAQLLGIAEYMRIEAEFAFMQTFAAQAQGHPVGSSGLYLPTGRH